MWCGRHAPTNPGSGAGHALRGSRRTARRELRELARRPQSSRAVDHPPRPLRTASPPRVGHTRWRGTDRPSVGPPGEERSAERAVETPRRVASKNASPARRPTAGAGGPRGAGSETTAGESFFRGGLVRHATQTAPRAVAVSSVGLEPDYAQAKNAIAASNTIWCGCRLVGRP